MLIAFALADEDTRDELKALPNLLERFWPVLSFTLAGHDARFAAIDRMLDDPNPSVQAFGIEALDHVLDAGHFSSSLNMEFGAKARLTEWRPYNEKGYPTWFNDAYARLIQRGHKGDAASDRARSIIAEHLREHLNMGIKDDCVAAMRAVKGDTYWEKGWRAVNDGLHFFLRRPSSGDIREAWSIEELQALERELRPRTLDDNFDTFVLGEPWRHWHPSGRKKASLRGVGRLAQAVGRAMARQKIDVAPYLDRAAASDTTNSVWQFMKGLARSSDDLEALWEAAYQRFKSRPGKAPFGLLGGILEGARFKDREFVERKLDAMLDDDALAEYIVIFHAAVPLDTTAVARFSKALGMRRTSAQRFSQLMMGGATKPIEGAALAAFLDELFALEDGLNPALEILHMRFFGDRSDEVPLDDALIALGRKMLIDPRIYRERGRQRNLSLEEIAEAVFDAGDGAATARAICAAMRESAANNYIDEYEFRPLAQLIVARFPRVALEEIAGASINDQLVERFFGGGMHEEEDAGLVEEPAADDIVAWASEEPAIRPARLAHAVRYAYKDAKTGEMTWSPLALRLIEIATDPGAVLRAFEYRFHSGGG